VRLQSGNAFGGTFQGKGNTGYRVEFDAQGKPLFYTTGASSSDVPSWVVPALAIGGAIYGLGGFEGLLGGAGAAETAALTAGDLAIGGGAYGAGAYGAGAAGAAGLGSLTAGFSPAQIAASDALLSGTGLLGGAAGATGAGLEFAGSGGAFDLANAGIAGGTSGFTAAELAAIGAGTYPVIGAGTSGLLTTGAATGAATGATTGATTAATTGALTGATTAANVATTAATTGLTTTQVADLVKTGLTTAQIANLFSAGATTAGGLLQQQTSKEAAQKAQAMIDAETAAAKQAAQFRPVGMTTRFGTSQFQVDPVTGQLISAGYTLSPEAKNAQDRFITLAGQGLTQAEGAQKAFEPLQTGAQSLFKLGQGYLAEKPEDVAKNYLASQMALLQPGRELELANLQNRLQQQGRGGLAVAQGGTLGATTPELQALFNARAQQEAQLAANAQQFGQQQVAFGAGLLGTGAQTMGQYYGGQQAAYAPYTTALGQVQALEQLGQQPLTMGAAFGQQAAQAGANVGRLGLSGAEFSTRLATGPAATTNPYSTLLSGVGSSDAFGKAVGGLFGTTPATSGFSYGQYGTGVDPSTGEFFGSLYF